MRLKYAVKNSIASSIVTIVSIFIGFVGRTIFLKYLDIEYLGINGLLSNILTMLSVAELGIGTAIIFHLYKPVSEKNIEEIKSLLNFYKKSYRYIAVIIATLGIFLLPFLGFVIGEVTIKYSIQLIYSLFLADTVISYLFTFKRSILYANQKEYIVKYIDLIYLFVVNAIQIMVLIYTQNYILYIGVRLLARLAENITINILVNKAYPYIKDKNVQALDHHIVRDIFIKVKALIFHSVGRFIISGTDNIVISKFLGIAVVGMYSNYNLIISSVGNVLNQTVGSITASVGNLLVENDQVKSYDAYRRLQLLNFWIFNFAAVSIFGLITPFITLWLGGNFVFEQNVVLVLVINFFVQGMRVVFGIFKGAAGIFHEDRYIPIIESSINLILSIALARMFGIVGIFIGTIASSILLFLYSYPKFVFIKIFNKKIGLYIKEMALYIIVFAFTLIVIRLLINMTDKFESALLELLANGFICLIVPNLINVLVFHRTSEFKYFKNIIWTFVRKVERS